MTRGSRRYVGDGMLAGRSEMSIVLRPHRLAGLLMTLARRLPTLAPGRQERSGRRATGQQVAESGPERHAPECTPRPALGRQASRYRSHRIADADRVILPGEGHVDVIDRHSPNVLTRLLALWDVPSEKRLVGPADSRHTELVTGQIRYVRQCRSPY